MITDTKGQRNLLDLNRTNKDGERDYSTITTEMKASSDTLRGRPGLGTIGLLFVTMIIGYEWLVSGLTKIVRGGFPTGLADELAGKSAGVPAWYLSLMQNAFIPNAVAFGYVIEVAEVLAGIALVVGPLIWIFAWERISDRLRKAILFFIAVATIGGTFLAINLHLANGATHPWFIPGNAFDEGIDLDSVLPATQIVIAAVSIIFLRRLRRERIDSVGPPVAG